MIVKKIIKTTFWTVIIIGTIMLTINFVYGAELTYLRKYAINANQNLYYYRLDIHSYLVNLQNTLQVSFNTWLPNQPVQPTKTNTDTLSLGFTLVIKYIIFGINWISYIFQFILLTSVKMLAYIISVIIAIFGLNTTPLGQVLTQIYQFQPPYIPVDF